MRHLLQITFCLLLTFNMVFSQSLPSAIVEDFRIQDVLIVDNETYYSSSTDIVRIDENNLKTIIDDRSISSACLSGQFYEQPEGWIYLGWQYVEIDLGLPIVLVKEFDGEILTDHIIDLVYEDIGYFLSATFKSLDSIFILSNKWSEYKLHTVNTNSEIIHTIDLELNNLTKMIYLGGGVNLVIGKNNLYTVDENGIVDQTLFNSEIEDVKYYAGNKIEVLTQGSIYWLGHSLDIQKTIALPQNSKTRETFYTSDEITYLIEIENDQSYISSMDSDGVIISEFIEIPNIKYKDIKIFDDKFAIWGKNDCSISDNILKLDLDGVDYEIPTLDLSIDDLSLTHEGNTIDTIVDGGNIITYTTSYFSWEMTVSNKGDETINQYRVSSSQLEFNSPQYIKFLEQDPLLAGESRFYSGEFNFTKNNNYPESGFHTSIGGDKLDNNCDDNRISSSVLTATIDKKIQEVTIYPNPAFHELWIESPVNFSFKIFDANGNLCLSQKHNQESKISLEGFSSGMYFIQIISGEEQFTKKFIKY